MTGRFPGECRRFLAALGDHVESAAAPPHAASCAACGRQLAAARRHAALLRALGRPEAPPALAEPGFLEGIHDRAVADAEARVGDLLRAGLAAPPAPADVEWVAAPEAPWIAGWVRLLPSVRTPPWIWRRVEAELRPVPAPGSRWRRRYAAAGLAAALAISSVLFWQKADTFPGKQGTDRVAAVVWRERATPIDPSLAVATTIEIGRHPPR